MGNRDASAPVIAQDRNRKDQGNALPPIPHPPSPVSRRLLGIAATLGAVLIWGLTFVPSKIALAEMGPFTLAVLRFCLALIALLPMVLRSPELANARRLPWSTLSLMGLTGVALYFGFQNLGLARTSATDAGLISGSVPAVTAALSALVLKERLGLVRTLGIAGSIAGVAVMVLGSSTSGGGSLEGDILLLGSPLAWAVYTLLNKKIGDTLSEGFLLVIPMAIGALVLMPGALLEVATSGFGPVSTAGWLSLLFLGVLGSAGAFFCWNAALRNLDAAEASAYLNLVPLVTVVSAALMLGEHLTASQVLGGALVLLGVYLAGR